MSQLRQRLKAFYGINEEQFADIVQFFKMQYLTKIGWKTKKPMLYNDPAWQLRLTLSVLNREVQFSSDRKKVE